jgi:hypothetical protein
MPMKHFKRCNKKYLHFLHFSHFIDFCTLSGKHYCYLEKSKKETMLCSCYLLHSSYNLDCFLEVLLSVEVVTLSDQGIIISLSDKPGKLMTDLTEGG